MPSDQRLDRALRAVGEGIEAFRSATAVALDEVRSRLEARRAPAGADRWAAALGPLARGTIDPERYGGLLERPEAVDPGSARRMREAAEVLAELVDAGAVAFVLRLEPGDSLRDAVAGALSRLGRAFGAARTAELARTGRYRSELHEGFLDAFPPAMWNRAEREIAPPLVVRLRGSDLRAGALAEFLDGGQKLVLDVEGSAPPASLVRLVTPGVLVFQTGDPDALARLAGFDGPAVAALFGAGADVARFLHEPAGGAALAQRLSVEEVPSREELRPVGPITVAQQAEELEQLAALAGPGADNGVPTAETGREDEDGAEPADRLAAWLLRQANLKDVNGGA